MQHDEYDDDAWAKWCENLGEELPNKVFQNKCATIYESAKNKKVYLHFS